MKRVILILSGAWIMASQPAVLQAQHTETHSRLAGMRAVASPKSLDHGQPFFAAGAPAAISIAAVKAVTPTEGAPASHSVYERMQVKQGFSGHSSPYRLSWKTDGILIGAGVVAGAIGYSLDDTRMPLTQEQAAGFTRKDVNWFDRSATYRYSKDLKKVSDQLGMFALAAPLGLLLDREVRHDLGAVAVMFLETRLLASAAPMIAKRTIKRYRPFVYNPDVSYEDKIASNPGESFFANQTTSVFSSAVFLATVFSDYNPDSNLKPYVWAGSLAAASAISYVRYATGTHYASDILVGAVVGSAIGYGIPKLHRIKNANLTLTPSVAGEGYGLQARLIF